MFSKDKLYVVLMCPIIPAVFLILSASYYSQNHAGLLASSLIVNTYVTGQTVCLFHTDHELPGVKFL